MLGQEAKPVCDPSPSQISLVFMSLVVDVFGDVAVIGAVVVFADIAALALKLS